MLNDIFDEQTSHIIKGGHSSTDGDAFFIQQGNDLNLLLRIVDDFLLISTDKDTSTRFLTKLNRGVRSLGVRINTDKSRVNYTLSLKNRDTDEVEAVTSCRNGLFPWCGLLIDTQTCEICLDHDRFSGSQATDAVTIHRAGSEGLNLKKKMKDFVRPRCSQRLLFSGCINGLHAIRLNFYQTFLLCAIKTLHYIKSGSGIPSLKQSRYIYESACDTIQFAFLLISSKIKHGKVPSISSSTFNNETKFQLVWTDALWLGRHAFFTAFKRGGKDFAGLCNLFSESSRASNRKDLLHVSKLALNMLLSS